MKKSKLIIPSLIAAAGIGAAVYAKKEPEKAKRFLFDAGNDAIFALLGGLASLAPEPQNAPENKLFEGSKSFASLPTKNAKWRLGYASASVLPENLFERTRYIAGFLSYPPHKVDGVLDDQRFRAICLDCSDGRGKVVFGVLDCVGISNTDVSEIRTRLKDFAEKNGIISINISAIHCHSAIDTQGMWGDLKSAVFQNSKAIKNGKPEDCISGREPIFMENLYRVAEKTIEEAVSSAKAGKLLRCTFDDIPYSVDSRPPKVICKDITKLHFIPDDGSKETVCVLMAAHPVCVGYNNCSVSSDYINYIDEAVKSHGQNCIFFQGAQLGVKTNRGGMAELGFAQSGSYQDYGRAIGNYLCSLERDRETEIAPMMNILHKRVEVDCDNPLLLLAGKLRIVNNRIIKKAKGKYSFSTEIGYTEFGTDFALALIPGEFAPELLLGGAFGKDEAYNRCNCNLRPLKDAVSQRYLTVIGLCNDSVGYILPPNDFGSVIAPNHYEESVSTGLGCAEKIVDGFYNLVKQAKTMV